MADHGESSGLRGEASGDKGESSNSKKEESSSSHLLSEVKEGSFGNGNEIVSNSLKKLDEDNERGNLIKSGTNNVSEISSKLDNINVLEKNKVQDQDSNKISLRNLSLLKKQHKNLNNQLHIFSHKVQHNIEPLKKRDYNSNSVEKQIVLPKIQNKNLTAKKEDKFENAFGVGKYILSNPKFKYDITKNKILKSKEILEENKQNRLKQAKEMKEANRLLRENIFILKEKVKEENRQKKKIVESRIEFIKSSISNFKLLKMKYIKNNLNSDIEREEKEIQIKQNQLETLKELHEKNKKKKDKEITLTAKPNANTNDATNPENVQNSSNSEEEYEDNMEDNNQDNNENMTSNNDEEQ